VDGPHSVRIADIPSPRLAGDEALVRPAYVGVCGTDIEMLDGSMPYFGLGLAAYPVVLGHELSGVVEDPGASGLAVGTPVVADPVIGCGRCAACRSGPATLCQDRDEMGLRNGRQGGMAELVAIPRANLHVVPDGVSLRVSVLTEPSVTSINSVDRLGTAGASRVLVVGSGTIGLVAAQMLCGAGSSVAVLERSTSRAPLIEAIGATPLTPNALDADADGFTGAIEASGTTDGIDRALAALRPGGILALAGVYTAASPINWTDIVLREITVSGVLNGPGRYDRALDLMRRDIIRAGELIDYVIPVPDAAEAFRRAMERGRPRPKVLVSMEAWAPIGATRDAETAAHA
jgi:2-desacetyl-2-hydroxyethyl bacteriochlorophyllide A dehydrogenase